MPSTLESLLANVRPKKLRQLILDRCREENSFRNEVLNAFEDNGDEQAEAVIQMINAELVDAWDCSDEEYEQAEAVGSVLIDAVRKAEELVSSEQPLAALRVLEHTFIEGSDLLEYDEWCISSAFNEAVNVLLQAAEQLADLKNVSEEVGIWTDTFLRMAQSSELNDTCDCFGLKILISLAPLATKENKEKFLEASEHVSGSEDDFMVFECAVLEASDGTEAAQSYMREHLEVVQFRETLIDDALQTQDYPQAERLCQEAIDKGMAPRLHWLSLLYDILEQSGKKEKQIKAAQELALMGDSKYYDKAKDLLMDEGRWDQEYPYFLSSLSRRLEPSKYMRILSKENETALLLREVEKKPSTVFLYGFKLFPSYTRKVTALCKQEIVQMAAQASDRSGYAKVGKALEQMAGFGAVEDALAFLQAIRSANPRRRAMKDELNKSEARIRSGEI